MLMKSRFAVAWALALAPLLLFIPAFMLAGMGLCTFSHPLVMVAAFAIFAMLELAAVSCFVRDARRAGESVPAIFGIGLALLPLAPSAAVGFLTVSDYL